MTAEQQLLPYGPPPEWLPNWRERKAYPDHSDSKWFWAWEFIRRNPEYIADYAAFDRVPWYWPPTPDNPQGGGHTPKGCARTYNDEAEMLYFHADPPALSPAETVGEYRARTGNEPTSIECHLLKKWGINPISDPGVMPYAIGLASSYLEPEPLTPPYILSHGKSQFYSAPHPMWKQGWGNVSGVRLNVFLEMDDETQPPDLGSLDHMIFAFDLLSDPKEQCAEALAMLVDARKRLEEDGKDVRRPKGKTGPQIGKIVDYLRVYDATWQGEKQAHIAHEVFGSAEEYRRVSEYLAAARDLVNGGYMDMLR